MKHCPLFFALVLFSVGFARAQTNTTDTAIAMTNLKKQADAMGAYFIRKDYPHYVKYINPKVIASLGGSDKMIGLLNQSMDAMKAQGINFKDLQIGEPSMIITTKTDLESVVPQTINLSVKEGRVQTMSYLVAVSSDNGDTWTFIDTSGKTLKDIQKIFPSLSNDLVIPAKEKPLLFKE